MPGHIERHRAYQIALGTVVFACFCGALDAAEPLPGIKRDPAIQQQIEKGIAAAARWHNRFESSEDQIVESYRELKKLRSMADGPALIEQMVCYGVDSKEPMAAYWGIAFLFPLLKIEYTETAEAVMRFFELPRDEGAGEMLDVFFPSVLPYSKGRPVFSYLLATRATDKYPADFVKWMYRTDAGQAAEQLAARHQSDLLDCRKVDLLIRDAAGKKKAYPELFLDARALAAKELLALSFQREWWVQLYVAQVLKNHDWLPAARIVEELKLSEHPLVQEAAKAISRQ